MKNTLLILMLLYLGVGTYLYLNQRHFIYFPVKGGALTLPERRFNAQNEVIVASILNEGRRRALLYFGGNAEDVDLNAPSFLNAFNGYTVYLVKYRGYGESTGTPSESAIYADALLIYDALSAEYQQVSVIGRSLGSAVATHVAAQRSIEKLALITPFDSVQSLAQAQFPIYPMGLLLKDKHDSQARASRITAPTLIVAAEQDRMIGLKHTQRLGEAFPTAVDFQIIESADHNNLSQYPRYLELLQAFFSNRDR